MSNLEHDIKNISAAKERIVRNVREALQYAEKCQIDDVDLTKSVFEKNADKDIVVEFADNFVSKKQQLIYCDNYEELIDNLQFFSNKYSWDNIFVSEDAVQQIFSQARIKFVNQKEDILSSKTIASSCLAMISKTGSIVLSANNINDKSLVVSDTHIIIATTNQVFDELSTFFSMLKNAFDDSLPSSFYIFTGTSRIVDIDGEETLGFGTKDVFLFLLNSND
jgi:L-lactate dehydrogenase complex protein LldG